MNLDVARGEGQQAHRVPHDADDLRGIELELAPHQVFGDDHREPRELGFDTGVELRERLGKRFNDGLQRRDLDVDFGNALFEIGFALAPRLWGTGVFQQAVSCYLEFLFKGWGVKTLVGKTLVRNARGVGAMRKLGAKVVEESIRNGHAEYIWTLERRHSA